MIEKETFILEDTNPYWFAVWLEGHTGEVVLRRFPMPARDGYRSGYYTLEPVRFPRPLPINAWLEMRGLHVFLPEEGGDAADTLPTASWLIRFRMLPLGSERLEVTVECKEPAVTDYFQELGRDIRLRWPKSCVAVEARGTGTRVLNGEVEGDIVSQKKPAAGEGAGNEGRAATLEMVVEARKRAYPVDPLSVAESLLSEALHCVWRMKTYNDPESAQQLDDILGRALKIRSQLPDGHRLELVLKAFHDGDEKAQVEVVRLADRAVRVSTAVGCKPIRAEEEQPRKPEKPAKPERKTQRGWDAWFAYYYEMKKTKRKYTLEDMADDTGYSRGHIANLKGKYDAEHGHTQ